MVGSANVDTTLRVPRAPQAGETVTGASITRHPGGKGANQAWAATRLATAPICLIARLGADEPGRWLRQRLTEAGLDDATISEDPALPTGAAFITVEASGENRIVVVPGANEGLTPGALGAHHAALTSAGVLLLQLEIPLPTVTTAARMGREKGATVILDPAPARAVPASLLALCDFVTPNENELNQLLGTKPGTVLTLAEVRAGAEALHARGARNVIVKLGARGALWVGATGRGHWPAFAAKAVDTTAAGDAFNAALAVALSEGQDLPAAGRFACAAGALATTKPGAASSLPARADLEAFLAISTAPAEPQDT